MIVQTVKLKLTSRGSGKLIFGPIAHHPHLVGLAEDNCMIDLWILRLGNSGRLSSSLCMMSEIIRPVLVAATISLEFD